MKTTIFPQDPKPPVEVQAQAGGLVPVPYYFLIGAGVGLCVAVGLGVWLVRVEVWSGLAWAVSIGLFVGALLGVILSLWGVTQEWVMRWMDWRRARSWADEDRKRQVKGESVVTAELATGPRYDYIARLIFERVYLTGEPGTRDACKAAGVCSPTEWDFLNGIFMALGYKEGYSYKPMTLLDAVALWKSSVVVDPPGMFGEDDLGGLRVNGRRWGAVDDKQKQAGKKKRGVK